MTDLGETIARHDRFASQCATISAQYAKGKIDRQDAADMMEARREFLDVDPTAASVIIKSLLDGAETERKLRAKLNGKDAKPPPTPSQSQTLAMLKTTQIPPLKLIVPNYIPEGLTLLASKPKTGKSSLVLAAGISIARGNEMLGQRCPQRTVLCYALEDSDRRMKERASGMIADGNWPSNFHIVYKLPPLEKGGLAQIEADITAYQPGVIFIDTIAIIKGTAQKNEDPYAFDYRIMTTLAELPRRTSVVGIVACMHVRKAVADDIFDTIMGTTGSFAGADTAMVMHRLEANTRRIAVRGRDLEDSDEIVEVDLLRGVWAVTGCYDDSPEASNTRHRILACLSHASTPMAATEVARNIGIPANVVRQQIYRMKKTGDVTSPSHGAWVITAKGRLSVD